MAYNILAISGSLRKLSKNLGLVRAFVELAPEGVTVTIADISSLPLFNADEELTNYPEGAATLKAQIRAADGILIATPEYNRGTTGALKNAIDWASRPDGDDAWPDKPVFIVGASSGTLGTVNAQYDLKRTFTYLGSHVLGQPEFYVTFNKQKFDAESNLTDEDTRQRIPKAWTAFLAFVDSVRH